MCSPFPNEIQTTVVQGARLDTTDVLFANVLATIDYEEDGFTLRDIRVEPTTVV